MYSKSTMILIIALAVISLTYGSPINSAEPRADTFTRTEKLNDKYEVTWVVDKTAQTVTFTVVAKTLGYVGLGISNDGTMTNADIAIGGVNADKSTYFDDRFSASHGVPVVDTHPEDWTLTSATEDAATETTTLVFHRKFVTEDTTQDVAIEDKDTFFIWALGTSDNLEHHAERGAFAVNILEEKSTSDPDDGTTEQNKGSTESTTKAAAGTLQISSLSCFVTLFLVAMKYMY